MINRRQFIQSAAALAGTPLLAAATAAPVVALSQTQPLSQANSRYQQMLQAFDLGRKTAARPATAPARRLEFSQFQPHADGMQKDTVALQRAIDTAAALGGAVVAIGAGTYLIGAVRLQTGVILELAAGATLLGSTDIADYYLPGPDGQLQLQALIHADEASQTGIWGEGTIDGRGRQLANNINDLHHSGERVEADFNYWRNRSNHRPSLIALHHCQQVSILDVTLKDSAFWVQHYVACSDLRIENIRVFSDCYWNNDGIDINDCQKVRVQRCFIDSADDAICLKSTTGPGYSNDDIEISDCVLRSSANGVKFGTESQGGFRRIRIRNIQVFDTYRAAIALETVDGARLEQVDVQGVTAHNVGCALFIRLGQRNLQVAPERAPGQIQQVRIRDVEAEIAFGRADEAYQLRGPGLNQFYNPIPASITGLPDAKISAVRLENIRIRYPGRANAGQAYRPYHQLFLVPQERAAYPEYTMFGELPCYGLFVRHVDGLTLQNVQLSCREADFRPALVLDDVSDLRLKQLRLGGAQRPQLVLQHVEVNALDGLFSDNPAGEAVALTAADLVKVSSDRPYLEISSTPGANATAAFAPAKKSAGQP